MIDETNDDMSENDCFSEIPPTIAKTDKIKYTDDEKSYLFLVAVASILLLIIPALLLMTTKKIKISEQGQKFLFDTLNFELVIVLFIICVKMVPALGMILALCVLVFNFLVCINAANSIISNKKFSYPIAFSFIKIG